MIIRNRLKRMSFWFHLREWIRKWKVKKEKSPKRKPEAPAMQLDGARQITGKSVDVKWTKYLLSFHVAFHPRTCNIVHIIRLSSLLHVASHWTREGDLWRKKLARIPLVVVVPFGVTSWIWLLVIGCPILQSDDVSKSQKDFNETFRFSNWPNALTICRWYNLV